MPINGQDAINMSQQLAQKEGIFTGITGGATFAGAMELARNSEPGTTILCMLPDTGERYLTTPLFEEVPTEMSRDEIEISVSTPSCRFDVSDEAEPASEEEQKEATAKAIEFVKSVTHQKDAPVVLFALEWCEFCWSVRKLFAHCNIDYQAIDLDSVEYQKDDWGGQILSALRNKTGCETIPQIFVGGEFIGGCTETLDAYKEGKLQKMLEDNSIAFNNDPELDPYSFFPGWLHPR
jgi:cysteine synthase A